MAYCCSGSWRATAAFPLFLLPSPAAVAEALWNNRSYLASHTLVTLSEILSGMALGVALGMVLALCMTMSPRLQRWVMPLVLTSRAIPVFALAPLLVLWFGFWYERQGYDGGAGYLLPRYLGFL